MALPATETFTATNNASLPAAIANWTQVTGAGNLGVNTNAFYPSGTTEEACYWNADTPSDNQYAQCALTNRGGGNQAHVGPAARCSTSANSYYGVYSDADCQFFKQVAGTWTQFGGNLTNPAINSVLRIEANGTTIRVLDDGVQIGSTTDSAIASGRLGLCGYSTAATTTCRGDTWEGGNLGASAPFPPWCARQLNVWRM